MTWGTGYEILFITELGKWTNITTTDPGRRLKLLKNYLSSTKLRKDWCNINKSTVINYVKQQIEEETNKTKNYIY